ncbi:MAG TPA: Mrp/NBP35 family ATP-binding protein [Bryobacterales bacterium]|jgi:ATP-binding protein involved in chromosome partitioning|nr:Mrp/NBP35 family ATP-binding protein [Bryobacterales bacterium]
MSVNPEWNAQRVLEVLREVQEPELNLDLVSLQMIRDIDVSRGAVALTVALPTPGSPFQPQIEESIRKALAGAGATAVTVRWKTEIPEAHGASDKPPLPGVKNIVAVGSGKGGVGKTTVAVNLAVGLASMGASVGLLDADVYGPNVPLMMGASGAPTAIEDRIQPLEQYGLRLMSMGFLSPGDKPLIWRGPMLHSVMQQFLKKVDWGQLDYLVIDLPPGTGDVVLSLIQTVPVTGAVIVTTPSDVSLEDARKAVQMFNQVKVEILGIVENMSYLVCPHCQERVDVFGHGGGKRTADRYGVPFLGEVPLNADVRLGGDTGMPVVLRDPQDPLAAAFRSVGRRVAARLAVINLTSPAESILHVRM